MHPTETKEETNEAEKPIPIWRLSIPMARICALDPNRDRKQSRSNEQYLSTAQICVVDRKPMMRRIERIETNETLLYI